VRATNSAANYPTTDNLGVDKIMTTSQLTSRVEQEAKTHQPGLVSSIAILPAARRRRPSIPALLGLDDDEMVIDNFAGGGGASTGMGAAIGRCIDAAINHDQDAIAMHATNHPGTHHYCEDVFAVDPVAATAGRRVGLAWFSPDCKHFSRAKGGKPVDKKIRGLAWVQLKWAKKVRPRVCITENVPEFLSWSPLGPDNKPCKRRAGMTFKSWKTQLENLGYVVEHRLLRACDFGAPTIRKRLFIVARCDGQPIVWPEPSHGDPKTDAVKSGKLLPWRTAAECMDWSVSCPSIFTRKKPLAEATLRRIAAGIEKFVVKAERPFIVSLTHQGGERVESIDEPFKTITGAKRGEKALVSAALAHVGNGEREGQAPRAMSIDKPLNTVVGAQKHALICATLIDAAHGEISPTGVKRWGKGYKNIEAPLATVTASGGNPALVSAFITKYRPNSSGSGIDQPFPTITANSFIKRPGGNPPLAFAAAFLAKHYTGAVGTPLHQPVATVTSIDHHSLVTSNLVKLRGTNIGQPVHEPLHTITAGGTHHGEVRAFLEKYCPDLETLDVGEGPVIVDIKGQLYVIVDIGMRMLTPRELFRAQGFPEDYIIDKTANGKPLTKTAQVRLCGNSVCPDVAQALTSANLGAVRLQRKVA